MTALVRQAGSGSFESSRDPRLGIIAAKLKCWAPDYASALLSPALDIDIAIPEWNPRAISEDPSGIQGGYHVTLSYEGHPEPDAAEGESFELEGSTSDEPIEGHWNLDLLLKNYKGREDSAGKAAWPKDLSDESGAKGRNKMHGVEAWRVPAIIWNHNFTASKLPVGIVEQLGTIAQTLAGDPPPLSAGRNWLCVRVRAKQRGNIWQITTSWELSGPHGWVEEMYPWVK